LTITANNQNIAFGAALPTLTAGYSGFVNGDTSASLTTPPMLTTTATASSPVGNYPISVSGAADPNYTIGYVNGTFTITPDSTATAIGTYTTSGTSTSAFSFGQPVKITGGVSPLASTVNSLTGSVAFYDGSTLLGTATLVNAGAVGAGNVTTSSLSPGVHTLTAVYPGDANHAGSTSSAVTVTVAAPPNSSVISGTVFHDFNTNGVQDAGEPGLTGQTIYLDLDGSGVLKSGDPTATTDANGSYQFTGLADGTYTVRQVLLGGVLLSAPASGSYQVTLSNGAAVGGQNFADVLTSIGVPLTLPPSTAFPQQGSANADYVEALYRSILDRNADAGGLASWTHALDSGVLSRLQVVQGIRNSPEHFTQEVTDFYLTLLGRAPDSSGLQNWVQNLEGGMREEQMAFYFLDSPEYLGQGDRHFIDAMYQSLLGRSFDATGEVSWLSQLYAGTLTHEQVITDFLYSTESLTRLTEGYYETFLQRPADPAGLSGWVSHLQQGLSFLTIGEQFLSSDEFYNRAAQQG
jgi:hypothetical protein